jgi:RNA polymerase sigma factor (sigma-70 family)
MSDLQSKLNQALEGDQQAVEQIIREFGWVVDQECRRFCLAAPADLSVSDARQEIWLKIWSRLDGFEPADPDFARPQFANWIRTLSNRVILGLIEKRNAKRRSPEGRIFSLENVELEAHDRTASSIVNDEEQREKLHDAIESLSSAESKKIVVMCFHEGLSLRQIAGRLSISYDQVRYRFHAALRELELTINP